MAEVHPQPDFPEQLKQALMHGNNPIELWEIAYLTSFRPNRRDVSEVTIAQVVVRMWAKGGREALALLDANMPTVVFNNVEIDLPMLCLSAIKPVEPGIGLASMLMVDAEDQLGPGPVRNGEAN